MPRHERKSIVHACHGLPAIFPGGAVRAISRHLQVYYDGLLANGSNAGFADRMHDFNGLNDIIGTAELLDLGKHYEEKDPTG